MVQTGLPFNSLYWDFCSVSRACRKRVVEWKNKLSIPFIGIFVLYHKILNAAQRATHGLSIPFIGIFVLYLFCIPS